MAAEADTFDLVIVGGGLAGLALAVALREIGRRLALIENRAPVRPPGWDARVYAISPASVAFLEAIGAWRHLDAARIAAVTAMDVRGDRGGALRFSAYQAHCEALAWIVEASALAVELWETVKRQGNVELLCPARPLTLHGDAASRSLTLDNGRTLTAALVVGADGRDSWVRAACGLAAHDHAYGEHGVVANFDCSEAHAGTAYQWFRDDGVLAWLPLPGRRISMVWSTPEALAQELAALPPADLAERVAAAGGSRLGTLTALGAAAAFPLRLLRVPQTVGDRVALLGDAAHGLHPLSGHGINLGFADARDLSRIIGDCARWRELGDPALLRRYQRARREETLLVQQTTHVLHEVFRASPPGLAAARNLGLSLVDRLPFIKSALVRYAMG